MKKQIVLGFSSTAVELALFQTALIKLEPKNSQALFNNSDNGLKLIGSLKRQFLSDRYK
jgi:hypothetical protein